MKITITYDNGYRAQLIDINGEVVDSTVDCYPSVEILISRIRESKTWFENLEDDDTL